MKTTLRVLVAAALICFGVATLSAQNNDNAPGGGDNSGGELNATTMALGNVPSPVDKIVAGRVMSLGGEVIPGAVVHVEPLDAELFKVVTTDRAGEFRVIYTYSFQNESVGNFRVRLTVTKKGFQPATELIDYSAYKTPVLLPITLRPLHQDPDLLSQRDLVSHIASELKSLGPSDGLSAKAEKGYKKGVQRFVDQGHPYRSLGYFVNVVNRDPSCVKCRTMLALARLDSGDWDGCTRDAGEAVNQTLKDPKSGSPEAMVLYGVMESWQDEPQKASDYFAEALASNPHDALALQEMGRAELQLHEYEYADAYLSKAIAVGAGPEARLMRVQAQLGEGEPDKASGEMTRYLGNRDVKSMPERVREIWVEVQNRKKIEAVYGEPKKTKARKETAKALDYLHDSVPELKGLEPAKSQDELKPILAAVGANVVALFRDFQNSSSLEEIHEEKLGRKGKVVGSTDQKFHYLCIMPTDPSTPGFTEYRENVIADEGMPNGLQRGFMLTTGFASAALIFHPAFQAESTFRYLGRQKVEGHETYVVAYAQKPLVAQVFGDFKYANNTTPTFTQGLAWIDVQNYQIIRMRTDLLKPLSEVRLQRETTQIDYREVRFKTSGEGFWLPRDVAVTVDWNGKTLRNEHQYSDFRLFNVDTTQKIGKPKESAQISRDKAKPQARH